MRIFASTPFYLQGQGAIGKVGEVAARHGNCPGLLIDEFVRPLVGPALEHGFSGPVRVKAFSGEVTDEAVAALARSFEDCDVIVAVGGGKALDAGKAVAMGRNIAVVTVPTIASTDGPASRGIAVYDDNHRLLRVDQMPANPVAVVVDTAVIAAAPARYLRAGIGDALAKRFEVEACMAGGGRTKQGTSPTHSALAIADAAFHLLRKHAAAGVEAVRNGEVTEDLEATVEAVVLLSALAFENGGLSIAHSVTRGLMAIPGARDRLHGEHVAYGTLVQIAADARPHRELADFAKFLGEVGLPATLAELGVLEAGDKEIEAIAAAVMKSPHVGNVARPVTHASMVQAIRAVEALG